MPNKALQVTVKLNRLMEQVIFFYIQGTKDSLFLEQEGVKAIVTQFAN